MQLFETLLLLITLALLVLQVVGGRWRTYALVCFGSGVVVFLLHVLIEVARWPMIPVYILFAVLSLLLLKRTQTYLLVRLAGFLLGLLLLGTSWFLATQLPVLELPAPQGPYLVGTTSFTATDTSRRETFSADPEARRELFVEVWYPAARVAEEDRPRPRSFWRELYSGAWDPVRFFMDYLRGVDTHSYPDLPVDVTHGPYPIVLFNHGLQMFTAQNTLLMEHLASYGYVIFSIAHPYESLRVHLPKAGTVIPEFIRSLDNFKEAMTWVEETSRPIVAAVDSIRTLHDREQRAAIMLAAVEGTPALNERVTAWVDDTRFVLDHVLAGQADALRLHDALDPSRIAVMGMSLGGAAAGEFCKADARCSAGLNIDGLQYGERQRQPLTVPFLMMYSDEAPYVNDFLMLNSTHDYYEYRVSGARHADFTDLTVAWPLLRTAGQLGTVPGERMVQILNDVVLNFLDRYLKKNHTAPPLELDAYPELEMEVRYNVPDTLATVPGPTGRE